MILAAGNIAFTARGRARVLHEPMTAAPGYAAIAIDVGQIDDHRQQAFEVQAGVERRWLDESERDALGRRIGARRAGRRMTGVSLMAAPYRAEQFVWITGADRSQMRARRAEPE